MAQFNEVTLPLAKEQILIVISDTYIYNIDTEVYDPLESPTFGVLGALTSENKLTRQFVEGVDFNFSNNQITFLNDDIFAYGYFVFKITDDTISRRNALDGSNLDIFKGEVQEEVDYILDSINLLKEDIIKKRVLTLENSLYNEVSLPMAKVGQGWYWTGVDVGLFDVASVEETISILDDYVNNILFPLMDAYVEDPLKIILDDYVITVNQPQLDLYVSGTLEPQLDDYTDQRIIDIQNSTDIGILANLETTYKDDLVGAINEVNVTYVETGDTINGTRTWSDGRFEQWGYASYSNGDFVAYAVTLQNAVTPQLSVGSSTPTGRGVTFSSPLTTGFTAQVENITDFISWRIYGKVA